MSWKWNVQLLKYLENLKNPSIYCAWIVGISKSKRFTIDFLYFDTKKYIHVYQKSCFWIFQLEMTSASMISIKKMDVILSACLLWRKKREINEFCLRISFCSFRWVIENLISVPVSFVWLFLTKYRSQALHTHTY